MLGDIPAWMVEESQVLIQELRNQSSVLNDLFHHCCMADSKILYRISPVYEKERSQLKQAFQSHSGENLIGSWTTFSKQMPHAWGIMLTNLFD